MMSTWKIYLNFIDQLSLSAPKDWREFSYFPTSFNNELYDLSFYVNFPLLLRFNLAWLTSFESHHGLCFILISHILHKNSSPLSSHSRGGLTLLYSKGGNNSTTITKKWTVINQVSIPHQEKTLWFFKSIFLSMCYVCVCMGGCAALEKCLW